MATDEERRRARELRECAIAVAFHINREIEIADSLSASVLERALQAIETTAPWVEQLARGLREDDALREAHKLADGLELTAATQELSRIREAADVRSKWPKDFTDIGRRSGYENVLSAWAAVAAALADRLEGVMKDSAQSSRPEAITE